MQIASKRLCAAHLHPMVLALVFAFPVGAILTPTQSIAQSSVAEAPVKSLGIVTVTGGQPTSLPNQIPTTMEGITKEQIDQAIYATDSEDAIKYFPSLLVRKRYIGDYNHAVLSSRASGTGNSARSAVYADGIQLSNYLGNGATYAPRWGLVTPEEIERVDVMYGPFSAAYPGNSVGAVVDYVTRMPTSFEAHGKVSYSTQPGYKLYSTKDDFNAKQGSITVGDKWGGLSFLVSLQRNNSHGQPLTFITKNSGQGAGTTPVTGAVGGTDRFGNAWQILGTGTEYTTVQDNKKIKLAYDITPTLRASYLLGLWDNNSQNRPQTYLRDAAGNPVWSGDVRINGSNYRIANSDFSNSYTNEVLSHVMHGLSLKSNTLGTWDWELAATLYDYRKDQNRRPTGALPVAANGGAGQIVDMGGTGWNNLSAKGTWRPGGTKGEHIVDFGYQQEDYRLRILTSNITGNWLSDGAGLMATDVGGKAYTRSVFAQDTWAFAPKWKTVLGARVEQWHAFNGYTRTASSSSDFSGRNESQVSPKAAIAYELTPATVLKASLGRAVRFPTVQEMYGATTGVITVVNDPTLKPEKSWTSELSLEADLGNGLFRSTLFYEEVRDSIYSQTIDAVTRITNVDKIRTPGAELVYQGTDVAMRGLDLSGSVTYANSKIVANRGFVTTPGDTIGKFQPRVPEWRATALATYRFDDKLSSTLGWRYRGRLFTTLNNADINGFVYQGDSRYNVWDLRVRYKFDKRWSGAVSVENLTNYQYWSFHPYPQRSLSAELKFDY